MTQRNFNNSLPQQGSVFENFLISFLKYYFNHGYGG